MRHSIPPAGSHRQSQHLYKASLSKPRQQLVEMMQTINFGCIEDLSFRDGEPIFSPPPRKICEIKFGGDNGPRPELAEANFLLKEQVVELFRYLDQIANGTIQVLDVKHGLPFRMLIADAAA